MKQIHVVVLGLLMCGLYAFLGLGNWREGLRRDDAFRYRCIELKRVFEAPAGSCLGEARGETVRHSAKVPEERSYGDLAAACKKAGGWLASSAGNDIARCVIDAGGKEITPP